MDALVSALLGGLEWLARYEIYVYAVMAIGAAWALGIAPEEVDPTYDVGDD